MSWSKRLEHPVVPPKGKPIVTLSDARDYALKLPKDRHADKHVQAGIEAIMMAAEGRAPIHLAQAGVAHIVNGPPKPLGRAKPDRPWLKRKSRA